MSSRLAPLARTIFFLFFFFAISLSVMASEFVWQWHGGDPRVKGGLPNAEAAQKWLLGAGGQNDFRKLEPDGLKPALREEATVRVRNSGLETITVGKPGTPGLVGSPIMGLTFGRAGTVIHGPIRIAWRNSGPSMAYIPKGMRGWVPATDSVCGNTFLVFIPPTAAKVPPAPQAPSPPEFALDWQGFATWGRTDSRAISVVNQPAPLPAYVPPTQFEMNVSASANGGNPVANGGQATSSSSSNPVATSSATGGNVGAITNTNQNGNNNPISIGIGVNGTGTSSATGTINQVK